MRSYIISKGIFTILRCTSTSRQDFVFFVDRLSTILVEHALALLPYVPKTVTTPVGVESHGQKLDAKVGFSPGIVYDLLTVFHSTFAVLPLCDRV